MGLLALLMVSRPKWRLTVVIEREMSCRSLCTPDFASTVYRR